MPTILRPGWLLFELSDAHPNVRDRLRSHGRFLKRRTDPMFPDVGPRETWLQCARFGGLRYSLPPGPKMHKNKKEEGINAVVRHQQSQAKGPITPYTNLSHGIRSISHTSIGTQEQGAHKPPAVPDSLARRYFTTVTKNHPFIVVIINVPIMMSPLLADHRLAVSQRRHPQVPTPPQPSAPYPPRP